MYAHGKGPTLLWINKDKSNLECRDHTNLVNSHAQRYQRLKDWERKNPGVSALKKYYPWSQHPNWSALGIGSVPGEFASSNEATATSNRRPRNLSVSSPRQRTRATTGEETRARDTPREGLKAVVKDRAGRAATQSTEETNQKAKRKAGNQLAYENSSQAGCHTSHKDFYEAAWIKTVPTRHGPFTNNAEERIDLDSNATDTGFGPFTDWPTDTYTKIRPTDDRFSHLGGIPHHVTTLDLFNSGDSGAQLRWDSCLPQHAFPQETTSCDLKATSYLAHPLSAETSLSISKLPEGFQEAALSLTLCVEVLGLLGEIQVLKEQILSTSMERESFLNVDCQEVLSIVLQIVDTIRAYNLTLIERAICLGLVAYLLGTETSMHEGLFNDFRSRLLDDFSALDQHLKPSEAFLWASIVIATSTDGDSQTQAPRLEWSMLDQYLTFDQAVQNWAMARCVLQKFFRNATLESRWETCWHQALLRRKDQSPVRGQTSPF